LAVHFGLVLFIGMPSIFSVVPKAPHPNEARQDDQQVQRVERDKPIERELAGGQSHSYQFSLDAGQYVKLVIEQRGIDVMAQLSGPNGKLITEFNSESRNQGQETVEQVAEAAGSYKLKVRPMQDVAAAGKYEIRIEEVRGPGRRQNDPDQIYFQPLPSTRHEALAIKATLRKASMLLRDQATESALKRARAPRILHIATHGFFLDDQEAPPAETRGFFDDDPLRASGLRFSKWAAKVENPLLRSGLALAGANRSMGGDDDGLLTRISH